MFTEKLDSIRTILDEHNKALGPDSAGNIDVDCFVTSIKMAGGTTEEGLASCSHETILECLVASQSGKTTVQPKPLAARIAKVCRNKEEVWHQPVTDPNGNLLPTKVKVSEIKDPRTLVGMFDPEETTGKVAERLKAMSRGQRFVVFSTGRQIDVDATTRLLTEAKGGYENTEIDPVTGKHVYFIGELPDNFADENPLYPNRPLRPDSTCDQTGRSWDGTSLNVRQLIYLAVNDTHELSVTVANGIQTANDIIDIVLAPDAEKQLRKRFPNTAIRFDELAALSQLPNLKIGLTASKRGNLLDDGKQVIWRR